MNVAPSLVHCSVASCNTEVGAIIRGSAKHSPIGKSSLFIAGQETAFSQASIAIENYDGADRHFSNKYLSLVPRELESKNPLRGTHSGTRTRVYLKRRYQVQRDGEVTRVARKVGTEGNLEEHAQCREWPVPGKT